jgi:hypothetical protein
MNEISAYTIIAVVDALIGETAPYGDTYIDHERLENQQKLKDLTEHLIRRLVANTRARDRVEYSMKQIGEDAAEFLCYLVEDCGLYNFMNEEEEK